LTSYKRDIVERSILNESNLSLDPESSLINAIALDGVDDDDDVIE